MPRMSTPPPPLVRPPPVPLSTPDRIPAVTIVPVFALLLTVTVRAALPRMMLFVISASPKAVEEPSTSELGAKVVAPAVPQVRSPPPRVTTRREVVPAAKPEAPLFNWILPAAVPKVRASVAAGTSQTPPLRVIGLFVGIPTPSTARNCPPVTEVMPV